MKVSVCMITYGHGKYIKEAIDGVMMQECDFDVELIIADDCSPDSTINIVKNIKQKHHNGIWITYTKHIVNKGMILNFIWALEQCQGKYIALCDGDDYWTDPLKLQKQVDFLEANPDYNYCGHKSSSLREGVLKELQLSIKSFEFKELIFKNHLSTATLLFRKAAINKLPSFFKEVPAADWALQLLAIKNSKAYVLDDNMSVYRIHDHGIWSKLDSEKMCLQGVITIEAFKKVYPDRTSKRLINKAIKLRKMAFGVYKPTLFEKVLRKFKTVSFRKILFKYV